MKLDKKLVLEIIEWLEYLYAVSNTSKITDKKLIKFIEKLKELEVESEKEIK